MHGYRFFTEQFRRFVVNLFTSLTPALYLLFINISLGYKNKITLLKVLMSSQITISGIPRALQKNPDRYIYIYKLVHAPLNSPQKFGHDSTILTYMRKTYYSFFYTITYDFFQLKVFNIRKHTIKTVCWWWIVSIGTLSSRIMLLFMTFIYIGFGIT